MCLLKKKRKFSFQSIVSGEFLKINDTMSDSYSSDSTSDTETCQTFIATKVQDLDKVKAHSMLNATLSGHGAKVKEHGENVSEHDANKTEHDVNDIEHDANVIVHGANVTEHDAQVTNRDRPHQIDHEEIVESNGKLPLRNKIQSIKSTKQRNIHLREHGYKYVGQKKTESGRKEYVVEKPYRILTESKCGKKCRNYKEGRNCMDVTEVDRQAIFSKFWYTMSWSEKKVYVVNLVERVRTPDGSKRREYLYKYFLRIGESRLTVCKEMFLATLGIGEKMMYEWIKNVDYGMPSPPRDNENENERNAKREVKEFARQFLGSLPKVPSHYCRASTSREYIEPTFTSFADL